MSGTQRLHVLWISVGFGVLVLALSSGTACRSDARGSTGAVDGPVAMRTVAVPVEGMICQVCAGTVKSALRKVEGVDGAEISLEKRNAIVHYDERKVSLDQLTRAITDAGYKPGVPTSVQPQ